MGVSGTNYMLEHKFEAVLENAQFLLDNGEHFDRMAKRLGLTPAGLEKAMARHKK